MATHNYLVYVVIYSISFYSTQADEQFVPEVAARLQKEMQKINVSIVLDPDGLNYTKTKTN